MLRGLCALAVVAGHTRGFLFLDYGQIVRPNLAVKVFYALTSLGHQSVMAFFALSGFLVGGKALSDMKAGRWSFKTYLAARLARLWTVLGPALLLTLAADFAGRKITGSAGYNGAYYGMLSSGPLESVDSTVTTMIGNFLFLQTISVPTFGTNGPLWSLANEFWYYMIFPLAASVVLLRQNTWYRTFAALAVAVMVTSLPAHILIPGLIWAAGAVTFLMTQNTMFESVIRHPLYHYYTTAFVLFSLVYRSSGAAYASDLMLGFAWALLLPGLAALPTVSGLYRTAAAMLSGVSYTLYATHFPFLAFVWFSAFAPTQFAPDLASVLLAGALIVASLILASALWWCFERNTGRIRNIAIGWFR